MWHPHCRMEGTPTCAIYNYHRDSRNTKNYVPCVSVSLTIDLPKGAFESTDGTMVDQHGLTVLLDSFGCTPLLNASRLGSEIAILNRGGTMDCYRYIYVLLSSCVMSSYAMHV